MFRPGRVTLASSSTTLQKAPRAITKGSYLLNFSLNLIYLELLIESVTFFRDFRVTYLDVKEEFDQV